MGSKALLLPLDCSIACSTIFNPSPSGELEGGHRERIYNGFTTEVERTNDGPSFAFRLPLYGRGRGERPWSFLIHTAKLLNFSHSIIPTFGFFLLKNFNRNNLHRVSILRTKLS